MAIDSGQSAEQRPTTLAVVFNVPNQLTGLRLILSVVLFVLMELDCYLASTVLFTVAASTDWRLMPLLMEFVVYESAAAGVAPAEVGKFRSAIEDATRDKIENLAASARAFVRQNEARIAGLQAAIPDASTAELTLESAELQSFQQQTMGDIYPHADTEAGSQQARPDRLLLWWAAVAAALALLFGIRGFRRR